MSAKVLSLQGRQCHACGSYIPRTIYNLEAFIRSPPANFDGFMNWEYWKAAIDLRGITPSDVDGCVEINNRFLVAETKAPGVIIPAGQEQTLRALLRTGLFTVLRIWGKTIPMSWQYQDRHTKTPIIHGVDDKGRTPQEQISDCVAKWSSEVRQETEKDTWRVEMISAAINNKNDDGSSCPQYIIRYCLNELSARLK